MFTLAEWIMLPAVTDLHADEAGVAQRYNFASNKNKIPAQVKDLSTVIQSDMSLADTYGVVNCPPMAGVRYYEVFQNIEGKCRYGFPIAQVCLRLRLAGGVEKPEGPSALQPTTESVVVAVGEGQGLIYAYKADTEGNIIKTNTFIKRQINLFTLLM